MLKAMGMGLNISKSHSAGPKPFKSLVPEEKEESEKPSVKENDSEAKAPVVCEAE